MSSTWRWDQGRLEYFVFGNLQAIASCLAELDGMEVNPKNYDPLRPVLEDKTGLPFAPTHYRVWRNYGRVFGCSLLAFKVDKHLFVSDICAKVADGSIRDVDEYLTILVQRFRYPSPIFDNYSIKDPIVFPFIALLKYLYAKSTDEVFPFITVDEVFSKIIGNGVTGFEPYSYYSKLGASGLTPKGDQERQVREMLLIISQFSFLKWANKKLFLDSTFDLHGFLESLLFNLTSPVPDRSEEFVNITKLPSVKKLFVSKQSFEAPVDLFFTEGKRTRITHLKIERSPLLRKMYFETYPIFECDMCSMEPRLKYPWTDNLLEIHHLLPLSSGIALTASGTSMDDIVPLCPNCHKSVHAYYKVWLNGNALADFSNKDEAKIVYREAKQKIVL